MQLKDQVLSIEQVQELTELGFDVKKYASVKVIKTNSDEYYIMPLNYLKQYNAFEYDVVDEKYYSLTIGDIIDILPKEIDFKIGIIWDISIQFLNNKHQIFYSYNKQIARVNSDDKLINALFETLKWCITYKHITI